MDLQAKFDILSRPKYPKIKVRLKNLDKGWHEELIKIALN
jgi:hypothetical protein